MSSARPSLLLTRPKAQSLRFADAFRARFGAGWPVVISPLTELVFLSPELPQGRDQTLIFTSETGIAAFVQLTERRDMTVFCVGPRTAQAARDAGLSDVRTGASDAAALTAGIIDSGHVGPFLHIRGAHVAGDVAGILTSAGIRAAEAIAYDQPPLAMTPQAKDLIAAHDPVLLPLFSPRAAELVRLTTIETGDRLLIAAISAGVAGIAEELGPLHMVIASRPDAPAMLDALGDLIERGAA